MSTTARLILLWNSLAVPCVALSSGAVLAVLGENSWLYFSPAQSFVLGAVYGAAYALIRFLPNLVVLYLWVSVSRFFGDIDVSRTRLLIGMALWALPEAIVLTKLGGSELFFPAWLTIVVSSWLPRAFVPALRPGVFQNAP
jgi:hypothetical protein